MQLEDVNTMNAASLIASLHKPKDGTKSGDVAELRARCSEVTVDRDTMMMQYLVSCINGIGENDGGPIMKVLSVADMVDGLAVKPEGDSGILTFKCCDLIGLTAEDRERNYIQREKQDIKGMVAIIDELISDKRRAKKNYTVLGSPGGECNFQTFRKLYS